MKFIHAADLHIDRAFEGLNKIPQEWQTILTDINSEVLSQIVDQALEHEIDFLLLSGDNFHQNRPSVNTQAFFIKEMERLQTRNIPVFLIFGNHDYYNEKRYWFNFPSNVFLFDSENVLTHTIQLKTGEQVAVSGFSYHQPWIATSKVADFPDRMLHVDYHIGMYHGEISQGEGGKQRYAPFSLKELKMKNYDYWALGHIHQPTVLSEHPLIVYSGTVQGHNRKERNLKGVALLTYEKNQAQIRWLSVEKVKWHQIDVSLKKCSDLESMVEKLVKAGEEIVEQSGTPYHFIALRLLDIVNIEELQTVTSKHELLRYLQVKMNQFFLKKIWLFDLELTEISRLKPESSFILNKELLAEVQEKYRSKEVFNHAAAELLSHPLLVNLLNLQPEERESILQRGAENIITMSYQEEREPSD